MSNCFVCHAKTSQADTWKTLLFNREEEKLCKACKETLQQIKGERCEICSRSLKDDFRKDRLCLDCVRWEGNKDWNGVLSNNWSIFQYDETLKELIAKFKYRGDYALAEVFKPYLKECLAAAEYDLLTAIPLSKERLGERGFNQAEALIHVLGLKSETLLIRNHTEKQSKKSRKERIAQTNVFQLNRTEEIIGQTILIIDDVYTTGSTLRQAAKVLKDAGAEKVISVTLAR
ncbi:ComF family protein [Bacillus massiliglaciei]|uniref:ComF family protein n=1 Tax=Bacillus massiliglaciei TaxID=1816693 RepID=UPI000A4FECF7|nr:ComF family protein [Bacillus massiliglaciei]